jgi:hypothetical protein
MSVYDLPTEGNPIRATRPSPLFATAKPLPSPPPLPPAGRSSCVRSRASWPFSRPMCVVVALFFWVRESSSSMSLMRSWMPIVASLCGAVACQEIRKRAQAWGDSTQLPLQGIATHSRGSEWEQRSRMLEMCRFGLWRGPPSRSWLCNL